MIVWLKKLINIQIGYTTRGMGVTDKRFFSSFLTSMMTHKTTIMGKLGMNTSKNQEKNTEQARHFFKKESFSDFPLRIEKRCFGLVGEISPHDLICLDEVDVAKPCAKKMEWLSHVRDGSTGSIVNGYMFHGASIRGIPVILEHEDLTVYSKNQIWKDMIERIIQHSGREPLLGRAKGIYLLDAGYEIASYIDFLTDQQCSFVIRAKRDRIWIDAQTKQACHLGDFPVGIHPVTLPWKQYILYMHVKQYRGYWSPIHVVSTLESLPEDLLEWNKIEDIPDLYFQRWEIERVFKTMKQEYQMEKIRVQDLVVLKNTFAVMQLAMALSNACFNSEIQQNTVKWKGLFRVQDQFTKKFDKYSRRLGLTMNRNSIVNFISYSLEILYRRPPGDRRKNINHNPLDSSQQRLFTVSGLQKTGWI
jgi:hypothetical protein